MTTAPEVGMARRGILTMAFGSDRYIDMAVNLARSIRRNWPAQRLAIITDRSPDRGLSLFDEVLPIRVELGSGLAQKIHLDQYTPFDRTLFLDSDCLVVRDMSFVWDLFEGRPFAVVGKEVDGGEWFGADLAEVARDLGVARLPKFNGGLMYWDQPARGDSVFDRARKTLPDYSRLGFTAFRSGLPEADEPLISIGMALEGIHPVDDDGSTMATPLELEGAISIDVLTGRCSFSKAGARISPAAPHFCGPFADGPYYRREALKLKWSSSRIAGFALDAAFAPWVTVRHGRAREAARRLAARVRSR